MQTIYRYAILMLVDKSDNGYTAGRFLRASDLGMETDSAEWKPVILG